MASNVIKVSVVGDAKQFERAFRDATTKSVAFGSAIGSLAAGLVRDLAGRAVRAVKDFVMDSVGAFSDLEQAVGGTEAVFGDASHIIDEFAKTSADSIGLAESEFRTATTLIGGQLKRMTGDVDFAAEQSIILTQVAADLAATYGGTTAQAVAALGSAFRGEADPAERFNLNLKIGVVNAKALEMGLADTTTQITEQDRAMALLALITEQGADAQGQFARESETTEGRTQRLNAALENQKALLGEAIIPIYLDLLGVAKDLLPVIADVAYQIGQMTGAFTTGEAAAKQFNAEHGRTPETLEDVIAVADDAAGSFGLLDRAIQDGIGVGKSFTDWVADLVGAFETSATPALMEFREALDDGTHGLNLTTDQTKVLAKAVDQELGRRMAESADQIHRGQIPALEDLADATDDVTGATDAAADAVANFRSEQEQTIDPMFAYRDALREQEEAQGDADAARDEYGEGSPEHLAALEKERQAWKRVKEAEIELAETTGLTAAEFRRQLEQMGIYSDSEIDAIIADFERLNAFKFASKRINVRTVHTSVGGTNQFGGVRQHGGPVREGKGYVVGEDGEELFVPNSDGRIIPNAGGGTPTSLNGHGSGPAQVINLTVNALDPKAAAKAVVEALQSYQRSNGAVPIKVREVQS